MNKNISEFVSDEAVSTIDVDATVMDAINVMTSTLHNYVLVTEKGSTVGIFTDRDLLYRVTGEKCLPGEIAIRDVMTPNPDTLKADDFISYAIEKMARQGFRNVPIVDDTGTTSVLTVWNIMSHMSEILEDVEQIEKDKEIVDEITDTGGG
jgi:CBS domain-containing protein